MTFTLTIETAEEIAAATAAAHLGQIAAAIDAHVEARAKALCYNSAAHLAGYAASTVPKWSAEASTFISWRDAVWTSALQSQAAAEAAGEVPAIDMVLAALPVWEGPVWEGPVWEG